jgi:two-component system, NarL family, sensor histidine kinase LiaS
MKPAKPRMKTKKNAMKPRLWWRLTLLCVVTTVLAVFVAQTALTFIVSRVTIHSPQALREIEDTLGPYSMQVKQFIIAPQPDVVGLDKWLDSQYNPNMDDPSLFPLKTGDFWVVITDANGKVLAARPDTETVGQQVKLHPSFQSVYSEAKKGITKARWDDNRIVITVPIIDKEKIIGYGFARSDSFTFWAIFTRGFTNLIGGTLVLAGVPTLFIGSGLGLLIARWIGRRLTAITTVAEAWGKGDLSVTIPETPADEFGILGQRLNHMARELQQVIALRQEVAVLEERENMLRELHDTVKQQAFAASLVVSSARVSASQGDTIGLETALGEAETITRQIQAELAGILAQGRTPSEGSLHEQLTRSINDWSRRSEIQIPLHLPKEEPMLTPINHRHIVRIVEEAVTNAVKHSGGDTITVMLEKNNPKDTLWQLTIEDNGVGFDNTKEPMPRAGMGMETMKERTQNLPNGFLSVTKIPDRGTKVMLQFEEDTL